jgi:hypothetical protein
VKSGNQYLPKRVTVRARNTDEVAVEGIAGGSLVTLVEPEQTKSGASSSCRRRPLRSSQIIYRSYLLRQGIVPAGGDESSLRA